MAQGTSLAMMIPPIGILAVMSYYKAGQIQLEYAGILALTFVLGAWMEANGPCASIHPWFGWSLDCSCFSQQDG